jgi:hypothetical protein
MGDKSVCYARTYHNGRGTLQDHLRRRGGGQLLKGTTTTSFLVSLKQSRKAAVTTANHLPTRTRPPRSHSARVAAPALAHRLRRSIGLRNAPCTPPLFFTQLLSQQLVTQRDSFSKGNSYQDETEGAER